MGFINYLKESFQFMTPHIQAKKTDFAKTVLMPGDPLRAKWIAETFLEDYKLINSVRGMLGYTGYYQGKRVSVMAHGMGNPSMGIYSYELFAPQFFDVANVIRIGSCGSLDPKIKVQDVIISATTYSESDYASLIGLPPPKNHVLAASEALVVLAQKTAGELNQKVTTAQGYAADAFYGSRTWEETAAATHASVVEMEAYALYANALLHKKKALCLLTVSDSLVTHEALSAQERQTSFVQMAKLALAMAAKLG